MATKKSKQLYDDEFHFLENSKVKKLVGRAAKILSKREGVPLTASDLGRRGLRDQIRKAGLEVP